MAAKHVLCCVLHMMLLCCIAECSTRDKHSTLLGRDAFARAEASINETARPLDRALFAFYFTHGSRDAVITELAKFQNSDGGFASCLESDTRWCGSSPLRHRPRCVVLGRVPSGDSGLLRECHEAMGSAGGRRAPHRRAGVPPQRKRARAEARTKEPRV